MRYISNQLSIAFFITLFNQGCSLLEATDKTLGAVQSGLEEISKSKKCYTYLLSKESHAGARKKNASIVESATTFGVKADYTGGLNKLISILKSIKRT